MMINGMSLFVMKRVARFLAIAIPLAYAGIVVADSFHGYCKGHVESQCAVCQVAHQTPALIGKVPTLGFRLIHTRIPVCGPIRSYVQFIFVAHGLSPPVL